MFILDNVCIESLSVDLNRPILDASTRGLDTLSNVINEYAVDSIIQLIFAQPKGIKQGAVGR
jgi:hypothetical protein